jgi:hypothetical protein
MKRTYEIRKWQAIEKFHSHLASDLGAIQMLLPLAEIAQLLRQGVVGQFDAEAALRRPPRRPR